MSFQRELLSRELAGDRVAPDELAGRRAVAGSRSIQPSPSSIGVVLSASVQANRLEWKSTSSRTRPASIRAMYSAVMPIGITPWPRLAAQTASQTFSASPAGTQIS